MKAVVAALKKHPSLNAAFDEATQEIVVRRYYDIGVATATDAGLVVPVVRGADRRSILDIARDIQRLGEDTKAGKVRAEDLGGSTFTITSLGQQGGLFATPILNFPEVAILGVHQIKQKPVVQATGRSSSARNVMLLSLSFDHRIVDGHVGAAFAYPRSSATSRIPTGSSSRWPDDGARVTGAGGGDEASLWARFFEGMPLGALLWALDDAGVLRSVAANSAARRLLPASPEAGAQIGELFFELFPVSTLPGALFDAARTQRAVRLGPLVGRDGRAIAVELVPLGDGAVGALLTVLAEAEAVTPAPSSSPGSPRSARPASTSWVRSGNILVVDDEPLVGRLVERALGRGHRVTAVTTGREGLDLLVSGKRFDLILCDLMMPEITGMDLYERVLAFSTEQAERMVFLTGGAFTRRASEFLAQRPFLEKPFDLSALEALVRRRMA